ncbi:MAG: enoyl-CoA hydratase [Aureispira sp.]|nr:enoyl-CoA hydratase [Aureispira sp.]
MVFTKEQTSDLHEQRFAYLEVEDKDNVLYITLNRPKQRNALNEVIARELAYALAYAKHFNHIWAVVIAANGPTFCAGADLKTFMGEKDTNSGSSIPEEKGKIILGDLFNNLHKPCIAKVAKPVYAGGFLILAGCTHVYAAKEDATFGLSEVKRGLWPFQVMASLLKVMPARKALDWCIQGKVLDAKDAYKTGLVTEVVDADKLDEAVAELVKSICKNSPTAIRLGLKAYQDMQEVDDADLHKFLYKRLMEAVGTKDAMAGMNAFRKKERPIWTGE